MTISMTKEDFFKYNANNGGKLLSLYVSNELVHLNCRDFLSLCPQVVELPSGAKYSIRKKEVVSL